MKLLTEDILREVIVPRKKASHKGDYGRVLIIGGNARYGGAAILVASAAVCSGAGLTTVATDRANHTALHARLPEAMLLDFHESFDFSKYDVIVIGSGLGLENAALLESVLHAQCSNQWLVIDGDAITLFSENQMTLNFPEKVVFTPHEMELQRLTGIEIEKQTADRVQQAADNLQATVVAKSSATKIFSPGVEARQLTIGTPAQATGGMGDTLAGMIGGFLAQFKNLSAVAAAVYLHSYIAKILSAENYIVLPTMIIPEIPKVMKKFTNQSLD